MHYALKNICQKHGQQHSCSGCGHYEGKLAEGAQLHQSQPASRGHNLVPAGTHELLVIAGVHSPWSLLSRSSQTLVMKDTSPQQARLPGAMELTLPRAISWPHTCSPGQSVKLWPNVEKATRLAIWVQIISEESSVLLPEASSLHGNCPR